MRPEIEILEGKDPNSVLQAFFAAMPASKASAQRIGRAMGKALLGNVAAVRTYVLASDRLVTCLLQSVHQWRPDLLVQQGSAFLVIDIKKQPAQYSPEVLALGTLEAPFSPWVAKYGPEAGSALFWVSRLRETLTDREPLRLPRGETAFPHWEATEREDISRFIALVQSEFQLRRDLRLPLLELQTLFGLNTTELGKLFDVSRQAVSAWLEKGTPRSRLAKVQTVLSIAELLERKLKRGRLPAVARKPASAYEGLSILEMIAADRHDEVLARVRESFNWAAAA
jgi:DNA-binding XRE family transcriptional regulator